MGVQKINEMDKLNLVYYNTVSEFKSVRRAIRRGNVSPIGLTVPNKPFNNRGNTSRRTNIHSRSMNEYKKRIYEQLKQYN